MFNVAVLIVNWQSESLLTRCLTCLLEQESVMPEIFVLDNSGRDTLSAGIRKRFPSVHFYQSSFNRGFAGGNNYLLEQTRQYSWIALVNPDAFLEANWLETMRQAALTNPGYSCFASRLICANEPQLLDGEGDVMHISGLSWRRQHGLLPKAGDRHTEEVFSACAAAALYRRDVLDEVGGFDEDYFCYFEDVDLGFRLRLAGYRCLFVPGAVAYHVGSATTGGQNSDTAVYYGHRNLVWTYIKNMPGAFFWLFLPAHVLLNLVSIVWFIYLGKGWVILKAKKDACRSLPRVWGKRRIIQKRRRASLARIWRMLDKSAWSIWNQRRWKEIV